MSGSREIRHASQLYVLAVRARIGTVRAKSNLKPASGYRKMRRVRNSTSSTGRPAANAQCTGDTG